jgi:beta-fructofuranosidase
VTLRLPDHWVWDAWYVVDGDLVHAFFLHAPRSLGNPDLRHGHARVGHAVSHDLRSWELREPVLTDPPTGALDGRATWTGSVIRDGDRWLMAFSGLADRPGERFVQRIGLAESRDLDTWTRTGVEVEADGRWYEKASPGGPGEHWRDPWCWVDPDDVLHLLITAHANHGPAGGLGVIGHAWSRDRRTFEVGPPLSEPGELAQLEVPQLLSLAPDRWLVLASVRASDHSAVRRARPGFVPETGVLVLAGASPLGPFTVTPGPCLLGDPADRWYAGRLVEIGGRSWLMTWLDQRAGRFVGELADPIPLERAPDGTLRLAVLKETLR